MSWAAYAFVDEEKNGSREQTVQGIVDFSTLAESARPLIAPEGAKLYAIVAGVAAIQFAEADAIEDKYSYPEGRIFGPRGELRWRPWCDGHHVVLLTDAETTIEDLNKMGFDEAMAVDADAKDPVPYLLWGDLESDGKWRDGRIPKDLDYPVLKAERKKLAWLRVKSYVDSSGISQFTRCVDVTSRKEG